jgi:hypothetical protein
MALGQLTYLPEEMAANPFHPLLARFSRLKAGSWERLFQVESLLVRFSWAGLLVLIVLVWLPLEEVDYVSTVVRLATLLYPCFFIWSLTRLSGVELMQLVLEGQWTADLLATPLGNRELTVGFASPIWLTVRQYFLITLFSLTLYGLETQVVVYDETSGHWLVDNLVRNTLFNYGVFFSSAGWIVFLYVARLFVEVRLRNGLLKGLVTLALLLGGVALLAVFLLLFTVYIDWMTDTRVLVALMGIAVGLLVGAAWLHWRLARRFRRYLMGQLDIDVLIFDAVDPQASAWEKLTPSDAAG